MTVRRAKFTDIPAIADLLVQAESRSRYADLGVRVDVRHTKGMLMSAIQRHDGKGEGATQVLVAEQHGDIKGLIIGVAQRVQEISDSLYVTDLMYYNAVDGSPHDARELLQRVIYWGNGMAKVVEITVGATNVITNYQRTAKLFERMGFKQSGVIYTMRTSG